MFFIKRTTRIWYLNQSLGSFLIYVDLQYHQILNVKSWIFFLLAFRPGISNMIVKMSQIFYFVSVLMESNFAFIDTQNINLSIKEQ